MFYSEPGLRLAPRLKTTNIHHNEHEDHKANLDWVHKMYSIRVHKYTYRQSSFQKHWGSYAYTHTHTITDSSYSSDLLIHFVGYNSGPFFQLSITQWPNPQGHLKNNNKKGNVLASKSILTLKLHLKCMNAIVSNAVKFNSMWFNGHSI